MYDRKLYIADIEKGGIMTTVKRLIIFLSQGSEK